LQSGQQEATRKEGRKERQKSVLEGRLIGAAAAGKEANLLAPDPGERRYGSSIVAAVQVPPWAQFGEMNESGGIRGYEEAQARQGRD
jgi:hypothetical protein